MKPMGLLDTSMRYTKMCQNVQYTTTSHKSAEGEQKQETLLSWMKPMGLLDTSMRYTKMCQKYPAHKSAEGGQEQEQ